MDIVTREEPSLEWKLAQPTIWATLNCGVRIQQLLPDKFDEVAQLIRTQLIPRETMCKALDMSNCDPESCETLVQEALGYMRDGFSIVGIIEEEEEPEVKMSDEEIQGKDEEIQGKDQEEEEIEEKDDQEAEWVNEKETRKRRSGETGKAAEEKIEAISKTERVVAAMIARVVNNREAMETFSRVKVHKGETYKKYAKLNDHVIRKAGLSSAYEIDSYYRIYHIVVHEDYKNRGISLFLGKLATLRLTALFKQTICVKLCPDRATQHLMRRLGFEEHTRVGYEEWIERGTQVFFHTGVGNYSIALMLYEAGELGDLNETLEEKDIEPPPGPLAVFPGRAKTGQPSVGNRGHLIKPTPPVVTGRLADYRYLFQRVKSREAIR